MLFFRLVCDIIVHMLFIKSLPGKVIYFVSWFKKLTFWTNKENKNLALLGLFFNVFLWVLIIVKFKPTDQLVPLHYNVLEGVDWRSGWYFIFIAPIFGLFFYVINLFLAIYSFPARKLAGYMMLFASIIVQIILISYIYLLLNL